eukprot:gene16444-2166_t
MTEDGKLTVPWPIGPDGRAGNQPRGSKIIGNIVSEVGMWEKQSSAWFQAVTAQSQIHGNVFYNGPRAAINVNDGFGGGDDISNNLIFNMWRGNVVGYVMECFGAPMPFRYFHGFNDAFVNNSCITVGAGLGEGPYTSDCFLSSSWNVSSNKVYTVDGDLQVCGKAWDEWVKTSKDNKTTVAKWPADSELIQWAKELLGDF